IVDDSADPTGRSVTLSGTPDGRKTLTGLAPAPISFGFFSDVEGGTGSNTLVASFTGDFHGTLAFEGFASSTVGVQGNFVGGLLDAHTPHATLQLAVGGAMRGVLKAWYLDSLAVQGDMSALVRGFGPVTSSRPYTINSVTIDGVFSGILSAVPG